MADLQVGDRVKIGMYIFDKIDLFACFLIPVDIWRNVCYERRNTNSTKESVSDSWKNITDYILKYLCA